MKKINLYLILFAIVSTTVGLTLDVIIPDAYSFTLPSYNEQVSEKKDNLWHLGKNLSVGDSYTYKICDPQSIMHYSAENYHYFTQNKEHNSSMCYIVKLDFANLLSTDENQIDHDVWVVQASIRDSLGMDSLRRSVFHINSNFDVNSADTIHPDTIRYANSLENTIFSIFKYTASEPKLLQQNIKWGEVTEYHDQMQNNPYMQVLNDDVQFSTIQNKIDYSQNKIIPVDKILYAFEVGYEIDIINHDLIQKEDTNNVTNSYLIFPELPFPLSGTSYSTAHVMQPFKEYEFELISFVSSNEIVNEEDVAVRQDKTIEDDSTFNHSMISDESIENMIDSVMEDITIVEDNPSGYVIDDDITAIDDVDQTIKEEMSDDVLEDIIIEVDKNIVKSDDIDEAKDNNSTASLISLVSLLIILTGGFVYYKKSRNSGNNLKFLGTNKKSSSFSKTITFDDTVTIKINSDESS